MKWKVEGADKSTGADVSTIVEAPSETEAVKIVGASTLISRIAPVPVQGYEVPDKPERQRSHRSARALGEEYTWTLASGVALLMLLVGAAAFVSGLADLKKSIRIEANSPASNGSALAQGLADATAAMVSRTLWTDGMSQVTGGLTVAGLAFVIRRLEVDAQRRQA